MQLVSVAAAAVGCTVSKPSSSFFFRCATVKLPYRSYPSIHPTTLEPTWAQPSTKKLTLEALCQLISRKSGAKWHRHQTCWPLPPATKVNLLFFFLLALLIINKDTFTCPLAFVLTLSFQSNLDTEASELSMLRQEAECGVCLELYEKPVTLAWYVTPFICGSLYVCMLLILDSHFRCGVQWP